MINGTAIYAANFVPFICLLIMIDILLLRPSLHFTTFVDTSLLPIYTSLHFTNLSFGLTPFNSSTAPFHLTALHFTTFHFRLKFTLLHFTTLSFGLTLFKFPTTPFHLTSLHFTTLVDTSLPPI